MTGATHRGTCFGFGVHSSLAFEYLRGGHGERLEVLESPEMLDGEPGTLLVDWNPPTDRRIHAKIYEDGDRYRLWISGAGAGWFLIEPQLRRIHLPSAMNAIRREERVWGIPAILCFLSRGDLPLHAAAIEVNGAAVLLAAPGAFGKTTLAAAFCQSGHRLLSEDVSCIRLDGRPAVVPGPTMLRVRADVAERLDLSALREVGERDDRVHFSVDRGREGCDPVRIRGIVLLRESADAPRIERHDATAAIRDLLALSFRLPGEDELTRVFHGVGELAARVPVWNLFRPLRLDVLPRTVAEVVGRV